MTARSHEIPDGQVRIGDEVPEPEPEVPPGLRIDPDKAAKVERLAETEGKHTALLHTLPRSQAERIIGHDHSTDQVDKHAADERERLANLKQPGLGPDGALKLIQSTLPKPEEGPPEPTDQAA